MAAVVNAPHPIQRVARLPRAKCQRQAPPAWLAGTQGAVMDELLTVETEPVADGTERRHDRGDGRAGERSNRRKPFGRRRPDRAKCGRPILFRRGAHLLPLAWAQPRLSHCGHKLLRRAYRDRLHAASGALNSSTYAPAHASGGRLARCSACWSSRWSQARQTSACSARPCGRAYVDRGRAAGTGMTITDAENWSAAHTTGDEYLELRLFSARSKPIAVRVRSRGQRRSTGRPRRVVAAANRRLELIGNPSAVAHWGSTRRERHRHRQGRS